MKNAKGFLAGIAILIWVMPLTGTVDGLLGALMPEIRALVLLVYCSTFALLMPIPIQEESNYAAMRWVAVAATIFGLLYSIYPLVLNVSATESSAASLEAFGVHSYPVSMRTIYASNGFFIVLLRLLIRNRSNRNGQ